MTSVRNRPLMLARVRPGLLAPAVVAIVLGILGMHGVDAHGVNMHGARAHAESAAALVPAMPAHELVAPGRGDAHSPTHPGARPSKHASQHASQHASGALAEPDGGEVGGGDVGDTGGMNGVVMLCVAMLAGAATALLALLVRRGRAPRTWTVVQLARRVWRPSTRGLRLGTGPPHVWRFSVIRC